MADIDFSIVIPTYNNLQLFQRALESVRCQQDVTYELIVTDDSSTSDISLYIESLNDPHIHYYHNQPGLGAVKNWNHGLTMTTLGKYIILMHHDEAMTGTNYLAYVKYHMEYGTCDVLVSNIEVMVNGKKKPSHFTTSMKRFFLRHPSLLLFANTIGPCACFTFRKEHLQLFCENLHWLVDVEWYFRMLSKRRAYYTPSLVIRSIHGHKNQISQTIDVYQHFEDDRSTINCLYPDNIQVRLILWLNKILIINTKRLLRKI